MVGLSVILENYRDLSEKRSPQVISKGCMIKPPSSPTTPPPYSPGGRKTASFHSNSTTVSGFLEHCFLCKQKLLPGKDIYMYEGDKAFCSVECRCRQILMDEEETASSSAKTGCTREYNCSLAATSSPSSSRSGKGARTRANNAFAY